MKLLLTGASGFFGSNLIDLLLRRPTDGDQFPDDLEIHTVQRGELLAAPDSADSAAAEIISHQLDLFDGAAVSELCGRLQPTHLCHMAWLGPETADRYRSPDNERWVAASKVLFEAFGASGGQRLVQLGSCIEYGNAASGARVESQPLDPDTAYGEAKAKLSNHVESLSEQSDQLSAAVARPFFCYGPHEQPDRLVPSLILGLRAGETIDLTEGRQRRDYLDARDVAAALLALLTNDASGAFNIGAGTAVPVRSIAEHLGKVAGRPELLNFGGRPEGADSAEEIVANIERITSTTLWRPQISLEQGLADAWAWWQQNETDDRRRRR